jgi:hypothetical protein
MKWVSTTLSILPVALRGGLILRRAVCWKAAYESFFIIVRKNSISVFKCSISFSNILKFCRNKLNLPPIGTTRWHICQICVEIFRDEQNVLTLQQNYEEVFSNVMLKYSLSRE